ncbi:hypothetical protein GT630_24070 [Burkholderia thailandensis]|nr:hypothetical protein [Burkholderia thailandensis]NBD06056.1 hypothetical protein [Burkholderia thailandensis]
MQSSGASLDCTPADAAVRHGSGFRRTRDDDDIDQCHRQSGRMPCGCSANGADSVRAGFGVGAVEWLRRAKAGAGTAQIACARRFAAAVRKGGVHAVLGRRSVRDAAAGPSIAHPSAERAGERARDAGGVRRNRREARRQRCDASQSTYSMYPRPLHARPLTKPSKR